MKRAVLICLAFASAASGQGSTRRATNIAALLAYPSFYHMRSVIVVGQVATKDDVVRVSDDIASIRVIAKGSAPDGLDEIRGEFWDLGRMRPDDPRLTGYDLKRSFNIESTDTWPRPGDVIAIVGATISQTQAPPAPSIRAIVLNPSRYVDQMVTVTGQFAGRNLFGDMPDAPGKGKYDFVLRSADAAVWITGARPKGKGFDLSVDARIDTGRWLEVKGTVRVGRGLQWLEVGGDGIQLGQFFSEAPSDERDSVQVPAAPPPEVVFSAPTQDETDVSMSTNVRIQFSRDIDPRTIKGHVNVGYLVSQTVERGEPTTPVPEFLFRYTGANRVLELKFTKPLERFRTIRIELTEGILGTDGQPLKPWTLSFDLGGS